MLKARDWRQWRTRDHALVLGPALLLAVAAFVVAVNFVAVENVRLLADPASGIDVAFRAACAARCPPPISLPWGAFTSSPSGSSRGPARGPTERDVPPRDVVLLGAATSLVVRPDFHPALSDLLLVTATRLHSRAGVFERPRQFPSPDFTDFPLSDTAQRFYRNGSPFLARYLPFWAASLVDRMKIMHEVRQIQVPLGYSDAHYHLRLHVDMVRAKVMAAKDKLASLAPARASQR
jgi:hypothetical protein